MPAHQSNLQKKKITSTKKKNATKSKSSSCSDRPKRPLSAYNHFFREERKRWLQEAAQSKKDSLTSKKRFSKMGQDISQRWMELGSEEKAIYQAMSAESYRQWETEMAVYRAKKHLKNAIGSDGVDLDVVLTPATSHMGKAPTTAGISRCSTPAPVLVGSPSGVVTTKPATLATAAAPPSVVSPIISAGLSAAQDIALARSGGRVVADFAAALLSRQQQENNNAITNNHVDHLLLMSQRRIFNGGMDALPQQFFHHHGPSSPVLHHTGVGVVGARAATTHSWPLLPEPMIQTPPASINLNALQELLLMQQQRKILLLQRQQQLRITGGMANFITSNSARSSPATI